MSIKGLKITARMIRKAASNQEKKDIIYGAGAKMFQLGYYKKDGGYRLFKARLKVPGCGTGAAKNFGSTHIGVYDMDFALKNDPCKSHRTLIVDSIGWALIDGILYDFREVPNDDLGPSNINNNPGEKIDPITADDDDEEDFGAQARRKDRLKKLAQIQASRRSRLIKMNKLK